MVLMYTKLLLLNRSIGVQAAFARGGGEPFGQKILASCPNVYETVKNKRGLYDALT